VHKNSIKSKSQTILHSIIIVIQSIVKPCFTAKWLMHLHRVQEIWISSPGLAESNSVSNSSLFLQ